MELVHAPVPELKALLTESFELWAQEGRTCALSGGTTALIFLPALRAANVDWPRITLFWADELAVDFVDPESNYGLAERMLLNPLGRRGPRTMRMPMELPLAQAAQKYDDVLAKDRKSTRLNSSHGYISYAVFCLKKKTQNTDNKQN